MLDRAASQLIAFVIISSLLAADIDSDIIDLFVFVRRHVIGSALSACG